MKKILLLLIVLCTKLVPAAAQDLFSAAKKPSPNVAANHVGIIFVDGRPYVGPRKGLVAIYPQQFITQPEDTLIFYAIGIDRSRTDAAIRSTENVGTFEQLKNGKWKFIRSWPREFRKDAVAQN